MSKIFYLTIESNEGHESKLIIIDSLNPLPGADTWEGDSYALGIERGKITNWGTDATFLHTGPGATGVITLNKFGKNTIRGSHGTGQKSNSMGSFPDGEITWTCDKID